jgi:hypothetical protein
MVIAEEDAPAFKRLALSTDGNAQSEFVDGLRAQRQHLTAEIIAVLSSEKSTIFAKVFSLKTIEAVKCVEALNVALPYVGIIDPVATGTQDISGGLVGARALIAIGSPAGDRLLESLTGKESNESIAGIAYVLLNLDGLQVGSNKVTAIIDRVEQESIKMSAQKILLAIKSLAPRLKAAQQ